MSARRSDASRSYRRAITKRLDVLGVGFDRVDLDAAMRILVERILHGQRTFVITANPEFVMLARDDPSLRLIAAEADLVVPDGTGVVLGSRLLGDALPGRAPGRLLVDGLAARALGLGATFYLLGAGEGVAARAAERLRERHRGLRIVGAEPGDPDPAADEGVVGRIAAAAPYVLLVAYGMPTQERWIARNLARLPSVRVAMGVGGVFDQLAGVARVAPRRVHAFGFEWLWRLAHEPRRWRRQRVLPLFVLLVLAQRAWSLVRPRAVAR